MVAVKEVDVKSKGSEDFDFMGQNDKTRQAGKKDGTATSGSPRDESEKEEDTKGKVSESASESAPLTHFTLKLVLEARKRAASPKGLDIELFLKEHNLQGSFDIETVLHGPLPKK